MGVGVGLIGPTRTRWANRRRKSSGRQALQLFNAHNVETQLRETGQTGAKSDAANHQRVRHAAVGRFQRRQQSPSLPGACSCSAAASSAASPAAQTTRPRPVLQQELYSLARLPLPSLTGAPTARSPPPPRRRLPARTDLPLTQRTACPRHGCPLRELGRRRGAARAGPARDGGHDREPVAQEQRGARRQRRRVALGRRLARLGRRRPELGRSHQDHQADRPGRQAPAARGACAGRARTARHFPSLRHKHISAFSSPRTLTPPSLRFYV